MAAYLHWLNRHWFDLVQTLGILAGISVTSLALRRETRARKLSDYLTLAGHHRELWSDAHRRPELSRIFQREVDLIADPISVTEEEFLNLVIVHFGTGWLMARDNGLVKLKPLAADARAFFSLPIPNAVWERTTHFRDPEFVAFVRAALSGRGSKIRKWNRKMR